jgi:endoglucanase
MAGSATQRRWLEALTDLPTAPGREQMVVGWVRAWARRRQLPVRADDAGNLVLSTGIRSRKRPVVAVAHMDHPALVVTEGGAHPVAHLKGGVHREYLPGRAVEALTPGGLVHGRVAEFDPTTGRAELSLMPSTNLDEGAIVRWRLARASLGIAGDRLRARACDDLAGVAAALSALDRAAAAGLGHFNVLLTRAEEVGFVGAIAACELSTVPRSARILSIECSRASADAPLGAGPIVRVGDASSVFSAGLTNGVSAVAQAAAISHQRKLMSGGVCEATAFASLGYEATGICLALSNYHNMVDIDGVRAGRHRPRLAPEEISVGDFDGLVALLVEVAAGLDATGEDLPRRLRRTYHREKGVLR